MSVRRTDILRLAELKEDRGRAGPEVTVGAGRGTMCMNMTDVSKAPPTLSITHERLHAVVMLKK